MRDVQRDHAEQNTSLVELLLEVGYRTQRIERLDGVIDHAINDSQGELLAVVDAARATPRGQSHGSDAGDRIGISAALKSGDLHGDGAIGALERRSQSPRSINKTRNSHARRVLVEAAWHYRLRPRLNQRQKDCS